MFKKIKEFFTGKPAEVAPAPAIESAPYKVPEPAATTPIPLVVEPVQAPAEVKADPVAVALDLEPLELSAPAKPAKKPRAPKAPKTTEAKPAKAVKKTTKKEK